MSYKVKAAVYVLQMWGRVFVAIMRRRRAVAAVRCIQANYRGYRGRLLAEALREEQQAHHIHSSSAAPTTLHIAHAEHTNGKGSRGDASSLDDSGSSGSFSQIKGHDAYDHTSDEDEDHDGVVTAEQKLEEESVGSCYLYDFISFVIGGFK